MLFQPTCLWQVLDLVPRCRAQIVTARLEAALDWRNLKFTVIKIWGESTKKPDKYKVEKFWKLGFEYYAQQEPLQMVKNDLNFGYIKPFKCLLRHLSRCKVRYKKLAPPREKSRFRAVLFFNTRNHQKFTFLPGLLRTPYENHAHSPSGYPPPFLFNEPLESDWIRHWKLNLKIQASQGSQHLPILPNKILFWLNTPQCAIRNFVNSSMVYELKIDISCSLHLPIIFLFSFIKLRLVRVKM